MSTAVLSNLDLLVVSNDYPALKVIVSACQGLGARPASLSSITGAKEHVFRHKVDGVFIDMKMEGARAFIESLRNAGSNHSALVFACTESAQQSQHALQAGANLLVQKPVVFENLVGLLKASAPMLEEERRRYFRHPLVVPITISHKGIQHRALTSNMSQNGMAIRSIRPFESRSAVEFAFDLPSGPSVKGQGEIMWVDSQGRIGVKFIFLSCTGDAPLAEWLNHHCIVLS
ncbi:MAG TPA: PilZ domain-containing protein [Candidatus Saccharimonadales bacterium]|jgi:CheY-like chemotaxis protein|nr:PilZ domain-containing protein [Candidatus Saccharimonadales bacterium]